MKTYKEFRKSIGFPVKERKVEEVIRSEKPLKEDVVDQLRSVVKKKKESDKFLMANVTKGTYSKIADGGPSR